MDQETFEKELSICRKMSQEKGGHCNWGECEKCGVIPLLYKLGTGKLYEEAEEIEDLKRSILR